MHPADRLVSTQKKTYFGRHNVDGRDDLGDRLVALTIASRGVREAPGLKPLCAESGDEHGYAREVCAGVVERRDEKDLDWIDAALEDDWDRRCDCLCRRGGNHVIRDDDGHMVIDETFGERRQSIILVRGRVMRRSCWRDGATRPSRAKTAEGRRSINAALPTSL